MNWEPLLLTFKLAVITTLILLVIGGAYVLSHRRRIGQMLRHAAIWGLIFIGALAAVGLWQDIRRDVLPRQSMLADGRIAFSRLEVFYSRNKTELTLHAAHRLDLHGNKAARDAIAMIKIVAPAMACNVIDRAIQVHGGAGVSQDFFLARAYAGARTLRLADGPDQVHMMQLGRNLAAMGAKAGA